MDVNEELAHLLKILENPTRRKILRKLTQETHYPLQLARELKLSQQAITKHLAFMEKLKFIKCERATSSLGPSRKYYAPAKNISVKIDLSPHLFDAEITYTDTPTVKNRDYKRLQRRLEIVVGVDDKKRRLIQIENLLKDVNRRIHDLETKRSELIRLKQNLLRDAHQIIEKLTDDYCEREILYYIIEENDWDVATISENLGLREKIVEHLLQKFQTEKILV